MKNEIFAIVSLLLFFSCTNKEDGIKPTIGEVTESVYASGVIKSENQYTVFSTTNGILKKINVSVGQSISKGQSLFEIESEKAQLNTQNALLTYQLSQNSNHYIQDKIAEMEMKVQSANDKLALDKSIFDRNSRIKEYKVISEVDFEKVELAYKNSKLNYESAKKQLSQLKAQLQSDQNKNNINLKINQKSQSDFNIRSAFSGLLFDVLVKEGTLISPQIPLAIIGQKDAFLLELEVDENDMARVNLNQPILVTMDSYKNQVFEAKVDKIYPIMNERSRTFKIEAHFINAPKKLYPNLSVESNIIIQTKKNTITIPKEYLLKDDFVLINKTEKRKVKVGLSDYQKAEILDGLNADEMIYKPQ
ncbi:efflux RND transporter periplasmic adaptor subunit [Flavobacterium luteum]|uniref:HlyD family efflux transporter periplasmic adaptor subunit n=1 Tax=Flavobacterium luteum TaxID=2026654 RepID=A0A7J5AJ32_9FLAO|nr:efflux RND transporter periplasmic adaptor subunit [Flavobacterium luteum]KAB1157586.1 HlyD family efflux transporter periplasmic adaptor subunit [Flavobacterium luteum]